MKISLILTTYNESKTIERLLESINYQTKLPHEVVIVDSQSRDNTADLIRKLRPKLKYKLRLFIRNSNRSQGRNFAVAKAKHPCIAATDAGCILDKHWLQRLTQPIIEDRADSVAGYYLPITPTCFQKCVAPFVAVMPENLDYQTFLPSSRSIAFTKDAWTKVGAYPENLNLCEDLVFARALKSMTRMLVEPQAVVYWLQSTSFVEFFHQIKNYAQGDIEANYTPHLVKIATVYLRYVMFIFFPPLFPLYLLWAITKNYHHAHHLACIIYLPALQITADMAVIFGSVQGFGTVRSQASTVHIV